MTFSAKGPQEFQVDPLLISAGQPDEQRLAEVVAEGATVITLRRAPEDPYDEERAAAPVRWVRHPTTPDSYEDAAWRKKMFALLDDVRDGATKVYLHCGSANRTGAAWALYLAHQKGADKAAALAAGRAAGMKALEPRIAALLDEKG